MRRIPPDILAIIRRQKTLRQKIVSWRVIAELSGVSIRAVLKAARQVR